MNPIQYESLADSINIEDITSNDNNRIVIRRILRNSGDDDNRKYLWIQDRHDSKGKNCVDYVPESAYDMGWLGYFVGRNNHLEELYFRYFENMSTEVLEPFIRGVINNKSIDTLNFSSMDLLNGRIFTMLGPFFENCPTLADLTINDCHLGDDGWRLLALAIGSSKHKSLKTVVLSQNNISDEALVDIITSLSMHPRLNRLNLTDNQLNTLGCKTLATLLRCSAAELEELELDDNDINDEGIDALIPALKNCHHLHTLDLSNNAAVSLRGWQHLATILETPNSNLKELQISNNNIDDQTQAKFVNALVNNDTFERLYGMMSPSITSKSEAGRALLRLLCDTSSVNSTYLSNHTLQYIKVDTALLRPLFELNKRNDKKEVAMIKILQNHNDFDMMPFFEWEFKVLPLMIDWFEKTSSITMPDDSSSDESSNEESSITMPNNYEPNIGPRKLSSIYQFVRGMPLLYVETVLRKELEDIKVAQAQMKEAMRLNEERKRIIMEKLGR